jgi:hypothetical protein
MFLGELNLDGLVGVRREEIDCFPYAGALNMEVVIAGFDVRDQEVAFGVCRAHELRIHLHAALSPAGLNRDLRELRFMLTCGDDPQSRSKRHGAGQAWDDVRSHCGDAQKRALLALSTCGLSA